MRNILNNPLGWLVKPFLSDLFLNNFALIIKIMINALIELILVFITICVLNIQKLAKSTWVVGMKDSV
jgi:hypothetical protein